MCSRKSLQASGAHHGGHLRDASLQGTLLPISARSTSVVVSNGKLSRLAADAKIRSARMDRPFTIGDSLGLLIALPPRIRDEQSGRVLIECAESTGASNAIGHAAILRGTAGARSRVESFYSRLRFRDDWIRRLARGTRCSSGIWGTIGNWGTISEGFRFGGSSV